MPAASNCKKKQGEPWKSKNFFGLSATQNSFLSPSLMPKAVDAKPSTIHGESMPASLVSRVEKGMHKKLTASLTTFAGECVRKNSEIFNQKVYTFVKKYQIFRVRRRRTLLLPMENQTYRLLGKKFFWLRAALLRHWNYSFSWLKIFLALCHTKVLATPLDTWKSEFFLLRGLRKKLEGGQEPSKTFLVFL